MPKRWLMLLSLWHLGIGAFSLVNRGRNDDDAAGVHFRFRGKAKTPSFAKERFPFQEIGLRRHRDHFVHT